jgi:hypothetical protein
MRKSRIALGLVAAVCVYGVVTAPALAFGKFYASIKGQTLSEETPGIAKGHGEVSRLKIGPYKMECKRVKSKGKVTSEGPSESFFTEVTVSGCETVSKPEGGSGIEEIKRANFTLAMEFLSNFSARVGEGESEIKIVKPSQVEFKASDSKCVVIVPEQSLPLKQKAGVEYEAALPETEEELLERPGAIEKYGEFRKRLAFTIDLKHLKTKIQPNSKCRYKEESEEGKYNPETGFVEFPGGVFEGDLEEVTLKNGNLWFEEE